MIVAQPHGFSKRYLKISLLIFSKIRSSTSRRRGVRIEAVALGAKTFCERFSCESSGLPGSWLACHSEDNNVQDEGGSAREF